MRFDWLVPRARYDFWGAVIAGAAGLIGSQMQASSAKRNVDEQVEFQREMSNTAYQRAVEDLNKAGLNPMLAYQRGGASSPPGAAAPAFDSVSAGVSSAMAARLNEASVSKIKAEEDAVRAQTLMTEAMIPKVAAESRLAQVNASQAERTIELMIRQIEEDTDKKATEGEEARARRPYAAQRAHQDINREKSQADLASAQATDAYNTALRNASTFDSDVKKALAEAQIRQFEVPAARAQAKMWEVGGDLLPWLSPAGKIGAGAASILRYLLRRR